MRKKMIGSFGALALSLALAVPASAASVVDLTYDLSGTTLTGAGFSSCPQLGTACFNTSLLSSSMKIRYTSNSASNMPILHGPATLQSLTLQALVNLTFATVTGIYSPVTTAKLNVKLVSPVAGSLLSGGTLAFGAAQLRVTGVRHCQGATGIFGGTGLCIAFAATLTSLVGPLGPYTTTAALSLAASAGPYGGAQSTRHTVSGSVPVYAPAKFYQGCVLFASGANLVGREILREAEGHDPKVTPEPGTLLLLGAGTAGLALVGRATRRSPH